MVSPLLLNVYLKNVLDRNPEKQIIIDTQNECQLIILLNQTPVRFSVIYDRLEENMLKQRER